MGKISIFTGEGHGKTPAAIGEAIKLAENGKSVVIIQFMKGKGLNNSDYLSRLEPEIKLFRFEKSDTNFESLSKEKQDEEIFNIKNGFNFAKKVISTGGCDLLILDEILGTVDNNIISADELAELLKLRSDSMDIILTGINLNEKILAMADAVTKLDLVK